MQASSLAVHERGLITEIEQEYLLLATPTAIQVSNIKTATERPFKLSYILKWLVS